MPEQSEAPKTPEFTGFRAIFWPVHRGELKKFLPMGIMMFCILFNYTVLRDTKNTMIVHAPGSGAEVLAVIKLFGTMPVAVLFMMLYMKLANSLSRENLFYAIFIPLLAFFAIFAFFIYPNHALLHMSETTINALQHDYPRLHWIIPVVGNWSYALFYIFSDLWGSIVIALLFWQFANEITRVAEAKRFYGLFGLLGNFGLMLSGYTVYHFSRIGEHVPAGVDAWGMTLNYLMTFITISGLIVVGIYYWMNRAVLTDPRFYEAAQTISMTQQKDNLKLSLSESFKHIMNSPYLGLIAIMILAYGISINLVDGMWMNQIKLQFPNINNYNAFMGQFSFATGVVTILLMIVGNNILRHFSWFTAAIITPVMILITSLIFFGLIIYNNAYAYTGTLMGVSMTMLAVLVGAVRSILSKATKYSLFDPTKEIAYIPLNQELKVKGKAAVDIIGGRAGKSGGAFIQTSLLIIIGGSTLTDLAPILAAIVIGIIIIWMLAVMSLSKKFEALTKGVSPR
jgi:AAA family ATP:ADP antiporter